MAVPDYQSFMRPTLEVLSGGETLTKRDLRERAADLLGLSPEDRRELLPSGSQPSYSNRSGWAVTYLTKAGALERPRRAHYRITDRGRSLLERPGPIRTADLEDFDEFRTFRERRNDAAAAIDTASELTPTEQIQALVGGLEDVLGGELLQRVYQAGDAFLEGLCVELLQAMGYGGVEGAVQHTGGPGDAGLDAVIRQDALGLDRVGVQAKCYEPARTVGRPDIQSFVGALHGAQATRGIHVTTAGYSTGARDYANSVGLQLVLIDGEELVRLMIRHSLGVSVSETFHLHRIAEDYFET